MNRQNSVIEKALKTDVLFSGYYGQQNTGDDAFCAIAAWGAREYWQTSHINFLSSTLPLLTVPGNAIQTLTPTFCGQNLLKSLWASSRASAIVYAGGSILGNRLGFLRKMAMFMNKIKHSPLLGAIGVSVGPFPDSIARREVKKFLSQFSFLVLRDTASYEEACSMKLPFQPIAGFDLAALLPLVYGKLADSFAADSGRQPVLGVSVCHYERYVCKDLKNEKRREAGITEILKLVAKSIPLTIRFFVFNGHSRVGDIELTTQMAQELSSLAKVEVVPYVESPGETYWKIGECDAVLATRLHAGIFAFAADVPFLMVEYHRKCSDFLEEIKWPLNWRINDLDVASDFVANIILDMITKKQPFPITIANYVKKAECNFRSVIDFK
jgi:polysaccharide pyruvyl transferase WcaK-like protein